MVMAEVQQMASTQGGEAFHARFVGVIARIQELLRQSREQQAAADAGDWRRPPGGGSDSGSAASGGPRQRQPSPGGCAGRW